MYGCGRCLGCCGWLSAESLQDMAVWPGGTGLKGFIDNPCFLPRPMDNEFRPQPALAASPIRARRESATQLSVRVPFGKTNIPEGAGVLYLGICDAYPARRPRKQRRSSRASTVYFSHDREDLTVRNAPYLTAESPADARLVHGQPFGADCAEMSGVEFLRTIMWVAKPFFPPGFSCSEHAMVPVRVQH